MLKKVSIFTLSLIFALSINVYAKVKPATSAKPAPKVSKETSVKPKFAFVAASKSDEVDAFEKEILTLMNEERAKSKAPIVAIDSKLSAIARAKTGEMVSLGYVSHESPNYGDIEKFAKTYKYTPGKIGENLAKAKRLRPASDIFKMWMNSPTHKQNIMNPSYEKMGLSFAVTKKGEYVYALQFASIK